jgi:exosortase
LAADVETAQPAQPDAQQQPLAAILVPCAVAAAILWALFAWIPYSYGYGDSRVSVFTFANWIWKGGEDWQHCYLVPVAIAVMIYLDRKRLRTLPVSHSWIGLAVTAFGFLVYWAGYRVDNIYIGYGSFQILVGGLILWLLGWKWMLALAFPWAFLVFLYPLPFLDNLIAFPLRIIMSNASVAALDGLGIDVVRRGTGILSAPDPMLGLPVGQKFSVDVADPCSGIRSLFALMMVSALYAHFAMRTWWRKWIVFLCSIPLAVLGNLARILILTLGTMAFGAEFAIGKDALSDPSWFHMAAGYAVFAVALGGMLGIGWLLNNLTRIPGMAARLIHSLDREHGAAPQGGPPSGTKSPSRTHRHDEY